jgi:SAM-dependent methyltransferase
MPDSSNPIVDREKSLSTDELETLLVSEALGAGDPTGWFDRLYRAGESGRVAVPWSRVEAHPFLTDWAASRADHGEGKRAIVVGCALGADAEFVASLGYETTAFDVSPAAIRLARRRHHGSSVHYTVADLLDLPPAWRRAFDLVVEIITVQALPDPPRRDAIANVGRLVSPGGVLLAIALAQRVESDREVKVPPWPLSREEIDLFAVDGLDQVALDVLALPEEPDEYRWRAEFSRTRPGHGS